MPRHTHALHLVAGLAAAAVSAAQAQTLTWSNAAGGSAAVGRNWNPVQIPGPNNSLDWSLSASYGVTFTSAVPASLSHAYHRGIVSLSMTSAHTTGAVAVASTSGDAVEVLLTSGILNVAGPFSLSSFFNTAGSLTVTGASSELNLTAASPLTIGAGGDASLDILNLASVSVADRLLLANGANAAVTARVSGSQPVFPFDRSVLTVDGAGESRIGGAGDASLRIDAGAAADFAGSLVIANASTSVSTVTIENPGLLSPKLTVDGDLSIGRNTSAGAAAGDGSLILNNAGQAQIGGSVHLADDPDGGVGLLRLTQASCLLTCRHLALGSTAVLDIQDGEVRVDGGQLVVSPPRLLPLDGPAGGHGLLTLTNGASFATGFPVQLGVHGFMELNLVGGSNLSITGSGISLGINAGAEGSLAVQGASSSLEAASMRVGSQGRGVLLIDGGASVALTGLMETGALSTGSAVVNVLDGALSVGRDLVLAGRSTGPGSAVIGGHGSFTIGPAGAVTVGGAVFGMSDSTLVINGGTLSAVDSVSVRTTLTNGVINARSFSSNTPVNASGAINARIPGGQFTAVGPLSLGNGAPDGISNLNLNVGPFRVDLHASAAATVQNISINGGILSSDDRIQIHNGGALDGSGLILGGVINDGTIHAVGAAGLRFAGAVTNSLGAFSGSKITFLPGSFFLGLASGGCKWRIEAGASALFNQGSGGFSFIGDGAPDGFVCEGSLMISSDVGIGDSDGFDVGPDCALNFATLAAFTGSFTPDGPVFVGRTGASLHTLRGSGAVACSSLTNTGLLSLGFGGGSLTGQIIINGSYFQGQGPQAGTIEFHIKGTSPDDADKLIVTGTAVMDGTVRLVTPFGFRPPIGFRRTLLQATSLVGGIAHTDLPPQWRLERTANTLDAVFCPPDFNNDGFVDFFDYDDYVNCFESGACPPGASADFNHDGFADFFDYDDFVNAFEHGC